MRGAESLAKRRPRLPGQLTPTIGACLRHERAARPTLEAVVRRLGRIEGVPNLATIRP